MKRLQTTIGRIVIPVIILSLGIIVIQCKPDQAGKDAKKISRIIDSMTLEQKAKLLIGANKPYQMPDSVAERLGRKKPGNLDSLYIKMVDKIRKYVPGAAGFTAEFPDLGITSQALADGPAGLRISPVREGEEGTFYCTAFPIATLLASTWDTELVKKVGMAMGEEVLEYGADIILGPALNTHRDPLCGRNFEYYSEDPLITGKMAAAMVNGIQSNGVGTSTKHFAANNQETNRMSADAVVSERALREIYLKGFEIAVKEAQPWTVMSSYNKINGTYTSESHDLLTKILRDDWGFEGYVMTDWGGGSDLKAQMEAGNDLIEPGSPDQINRLIALVDSGELDEAILDRNLSRVLRVMMKTPRYRGYEASGDPDLKGHAEVTRQAATEGMVLLENRDQTLPFKETIKEIAVFGNTSYEFLSGGTGSGDVNEAYTVSLMEGLTNAGFMIDEETAELYVSHIKTEKEKRGEPRNWWEAMRMKNEPVVEMVVNTELAEKMAGKADIAMITIGRLTGEGGDKKPVPGDFYLTETEWSNMKTITEAFQSQGKKTVVILNIGSPIETASWKNIPDAILCAWQPGQEAGNSVVDVLKGKANPSGKLATSFPVSYDDTPTAKNFPGQPIQSDENDTTEDRSGFSFWRRVPWEVFYEEDIYVGYRYYSTFDVPVSYEFGYGLSYTEFEYANLSLSSSSFKKSLTVSVEVTNTGDVAGKEAVQVYLTAPDGILEKPAIELVAFGKTGLLEPDGSETLEFTLDADDLASFDASRSSWIVEPGEYIIKVGSSSANIRLSGSFTVSGEIIAGKVSRALVPEKEITLLKK